MEIYTSVNIKWKDQMNTDTPSNHEYNEQERCEKNLDKLPHTRQMYTRLHFIHRAYIPIPEHCLLTNKPTTFYWFPLYFIFPCFCPCTPPRKNECTANQRRSTAHTATIRQPSFPFRKSHVGRLSTYYASEPKQIVRKSCPISWPVIADHMTAGYSSCVFFFLEQQCWSSRRYNVTRGHR